MNKHITILGLTLIGLFNSCQKDTDIYQNFYVPIFKAEIYENMMSSENKPIKSLKCIYEYNKDGYPIEMHSYSSSGDSRTTYNMYYDIPFGVVNKIVRKTGDIIQEGEFNNTYNSMGKLISGSGYSYVYNVNGLLTSKIGWDDTIQYLYENNRLVKQIVNRKEGILESDHYFTYTYNQANEYDTIKSFFADTLHSYLAYEYSNSPRTIKIRKAFAGQYNDQIYIEKFEFDEYNRPTWWGSNDVGDSFEYNEKFDLKPLLLPSFYELNFFGIYETSYIREHYFMLFK